MKKRDFLRKYNFKKLGPFVFPDLHIYNILGKMRVIFFVLGSFFFPRKIIFCRSDRTMRSIKHHLRTKGIKGNTSSECHILYDEYMTYFDSFSPFVFEKSYFALFRQRRKWQPKSTHKKKTYKNTSIHSKTPLMMLLKGQVFSVIDQLRRKLRTIELLKSWLIAKHNKEQ